VTTLNYKRAIAATTRAAPLRTTVVADEALALFSPLMFSVGPGVGAGVACTSHSEPVHPALQTQVWASLHEPFPEHTAV
jgi:hypothetical protein